MQSSRNDREAVITRQIVAEISTALKQIGADEKLLSEFPAMSADELYSATKELKADPMLLAFIGSWGDTLLDEDILQCLRRWNERQGAALN